MDCTLEANKEKCACPNTDCERRGICCECVQNHLGRR